MGRATSGSMLETRESVVLLGDQFGVHMPRALSQFVASLGPVAGAMDAAFPFIAIVTGITILVQKLESLHAAAAKQAEGWSKLGDDSEAALQKTEREIKQTQNAIDELTGTKLTALQHKLQEIDQQKFDNLVGNLAKVGGEIDTLLGAQQRGTVMSMLFGQNFEGDLKVQFDKFRNHYSGLLQNGDNKLAAEALEKEIGNVGTKLEELKAKAASTTDMSLSGSVAGAGLTKDLATANALYNQLITIAAQQEDQEKLAGKKKTLATDESDAVGPFVDAQNTKRVSLSQTMALVKQAQETADAAAKLELEGQEGLIKGLQEEAKLRAEAGKEDGRHDTSMATLQAAADREAAQMKMAQGRMSEQEYLDMELGFAAQEYAAKKAALTRELDALEGNGADVLNKKRELNNKLLELDKQFQNQDQMLEDQAQKKQLTSLQEAENKMRNVSAQSLTQVLMGKESFGKMMQQLDSQIASTALQNMIMSLEQKRGVDGETRLSDARTAAADAWRDAGNPILGAVMAAATFAEVMALADGGIVPGVGLGDTVPAMLTPGEAVLPKRMTEDLQHAAKFGGDNGGGDVHVHYHHTSHIQAFDSTGVDKVLQQHGDKFTKHAVSTLRKMNRG